MGLTEQKNKQIIEAAIAEFQDRGFAGASMDRISERAQVSKRTVYNHFESKDALFRSITQCLVERLRVSMDISFNPGEPIRDELIRLGWAQGNVLTDPCAMNMARMIMGEILRDPKMAQEMYERMDLVSSVRHFLDAAVAADFLIIADTHVAAEQFLGLIKSRGFYSKLFDDAIATREEMAGIIESTVDMFLNSYQAGAVTRQREELARSA